ncbi:S-adenosylmethionine decarboxylase [Paenibacillus sp. KN14-4R]|uniref:S-adenosylmethionine decarboxylase n=1 Tax=Paenibacillus sp. KN14-4R TaxID=3445773 RepID=UPI003F9ED158
MRLRKFKINGGILYVLLAILLIWPTFQLFSGGSDSSGHHGNAEKLLYEVSLFQMEILNSQLSNPSRFTQTTALDGVKSAVYSVSFTHERLRLAIGENNLADMDGLPQLLQYMMRLQMGAQRPLKSEEMEVFVAASKLVSEMYGNYEKLLTSTGEVVPSQNELLAGNNTKLRKLLQNK